MDELMSGRHSVGQPGKIARGRGVFPPGMHHSIRFVGVGILPLESVGCPGFSG